MNNSRYANTSILSNNRNNQKSFSGTNDRIDKLADKLKKISGAIENEKSCKYDQYEMKIMGLYSSIDETKEFNNKKLNEVKDSI